MKPTLLDIIDYGTIGGDHLAGEARFSDGKRYRFVINGEMDYSGRTQAPTRKAPAVLKMALPYMPKVGAYGKPPEEQWAYGNDKRIFPKRAALIMAAYPEYLARAKVEKAESDAAEEAQRKAEREAYLRDKALKEAAPDLLAACQALIKDAKVFGLAGETNHPAVKCRVEGLTLGHFNVLTAAIAKATTITS